MIQNKRIRIIINACILCAVIIGTFWMTYELRSIFNPLLLSIMFAYIFDPIVSLMERFKINRAITIFVLYILLFVALVGIFLFIIPIVGSEINYFANNAFKNDEYVDANGNGQWDWKDANENGIVDPGEAEELTVDHNNNGKYNLSYWRVIQKWITESIAKWNEKNPNKKIDRDSVTEFLTDSDILKEHSKEFINLSLIGLKTLTKTILGFFSLLSYLILLPLYTFFILKEFHGIGNVFYDYLPAENKKDHTQVLTNIQEAISAFFRGKMIICLVKGVLTWGLLSLLGVKYALIFAIIQTIASLVAFLVLLVGMIPNFVLVILDSGFNIPYLLAILAVYVLLECLESFLLTPWIMGNKTGLHPVTVIITLLIGAKLFGLFGLIIAIPLCTTLKILGKSYLIPMWHEISGCTAGSPSTSKS